MSDDSDATPTPVIPAGAAPAAGAPAAGAPDPDAEIIAALQKDPEGIRKLLAGKRDAKGEAKTYRTELDTWKTKAEQLEAQRQKELEDAENAKLSETEKLTKELGKHQTTAQTLQAQLAQRDDELTSLRVQNAALLLGATNPRYLEFEYREHLKSLSDADRTAFGPEQMATWLAAFKEKEPDAFRPAAAEPRVPGQSRPTPPGGGRPPERVPEPVVDAKLRNPRTPQDQAALTRSINSIIHGR